MWKIKPNFIWLINPFTLNLYGKKNPMILRASHMSSLLAKDDYVAKYVSYLSINEENFLC